MRPDGRVLKTIDSMQKMIPHLMTKRYDAQVYFKTKIDYTNTKKYINKKRKEGIEISFMSVFFAAYLYTVAKLPQLNRFVMNKRTYARNEFWISFMILKRDNDSDEPIESVIKLKFEFTDTLTAISNRINEAIADNVKMDVENSSDKIIDLFMDVPFLSGPAISFAKYLDKIGLLPKAAIDASPFHTTLFLTNLTSLKLDTVYHHIYDFGTTSTFVSMGSLSTKKTKAGKKKYIITMGMVVDERICEGVIFAKGLSYIKEYIANPELLEIPVESVKQDMK